MVKEKFVPGDWVTIKNQSELTGGCYGVGKGTFEVIEFDHTLNQHAGMHGYDPDVIFVRGRKGKVWCISGKFKRASEDEIQKVNGIQLKTIIMNKLKELPSIWHVVVTEENQKVLSKWRHIQHGYLVPVGAIVGMTRWYGEVLEKGHNPGNRVKSNSYDFGKEISFLDFKRIVLNDYVFPEKWAIKRTKETDRVITDYISKRNDHMHARYESNIDFPWIHNQSGVTSSVKLKSGFTEISYQEFVDYVLSVPIKSIIGYKLIKEYPLSNTIGYIETDINASWIQGYEEFWEPIYGEEFKIGDWITVTDNLDGWLLETKESTFKIVKDLASYAGGYHWGIKSVRTGEYGGLCADFRKATEEEIRLAQLPKVVVNNYEGEFFEEYVKFGCAEIDKNYFIHFDGLSGFDKGNKSITSVTIGRGNFTNADIKKIADYYLKR